MKAGLRPSARTGPRVASALTTAAFAELGSEWNALAAEIDDQFFYRHEFLRVWLEHFGSGENPFVLTLRGRAGGLEAVLPLMRRRASWYAIPVRELASPTNDHSCRFDLLARDPRMAAERFLDLLAMDRDWDVLRLTDVPEGGRAFALIEAARARGHPVGVWEAQRSPYVHLPDTMEELRARLSRGFRANLRRRRKRLGEKGTLSVERVGGGPQLSAALGEGLALEAGGWKGRLGTAMAQDAAVKGFYIALARAAAGLGGLGLYFLRLDRRLASFLYALEYRGRGLLLKCAYDERLKECSPGQLALEEAFNSFIARGMSELDFLGEDMVWKRDWAGRARGHHWLYVFRDNRWGRALHDLKFACTPRIKAWVNRWRT